MLPTEFDLSTLPGRLRWARDRLGWSQGKLAEQIGLRQSAIGNLESGARKQARDIVSIAAALGVSAMWLETGRGTPLAAASSSAWPFERVTPDEWAALTERQKGAIEQDVIRAMRDLVADAPLRKANGPRG